MGAEFHPGLDVDGELIYKATGPEDGYSAFSVQHLPTGEVRGTGLEELLHERNIRRVVLLGLATDYCVRESGLDARRRGFDTEVLVEGVRAVDREAGDGDRALQDLAAAGVRLL